MASIRREIRELGRLAAPVAVTQLGMISMGIVDTKMVGVLGTKALSGVALGDLWVFGTSILAMGLLFGLDPLITQAHGSGDETALGLSLQRGLLLAVIFSVPLATSWLYTETILATLDQDAGLCRVAQTYARPQLFSALPWLVFTVYRQYLQGRGIVVPALVVALVANVFNYFGNWALIHGHLGLPALGVRGAGIATGLTKAFMMGLLIAWAFGRHLHRGAWTPWTRSAFHLRGLGQVLAFGVPVAAQIGLEVWAFHAAVLIAGRLGAAELAAHTIVLKIATVSFMIPYGISQAAATRVGNLIGAGRRGDAQRAAWIAFIMGAAVMATAAVVFVLGRHELPALFSTAPDVLTLCATVLPIAATFQIFDGIQVVGAGILRGNGDTRPAAFFTLFGFYALALPLALFLTGPVGLGLSGIWWGLFTGLAVVAVLVLAWVWRRGPLHQVIDAHTVD